MDHIRNLDGDVAARNGHILYAGWVLAHFTRDRDSSGTDKSYPG